MIVCKKTVKNDDGTYTTTWQLTEEEMNYLITFAIGYLVTEGVVAVEEESPSKEQLELEFLEGLDEEELHRA